MVDKRAGGDYRRLEVGIAADADLPVLRCCLRRAAVKGAVLESHLAVAVASAAFDQKDEAEQLTAACQGG